MIRPPSIRTRLVLIAEPDESGLFIVLYALLVVAMFSMVAIVIDLSQLRNIRRTSQTVTDFAALAAAAELADITGVSPVQACRDAFEYVKKNTPDFPVAATIPCGDLATVVPARIPCSDTTPATPPLDLEASNTDPYHLHIVYPVPDSLIDDPRRGGVGTKDGAHCERMQVSISKTGGSFFAKVFGFNTLEQGASSTARGFIKNDGKDVPALLILELQACGALQASGQGGIVAKGAGIKPGLIAVASAGSASPGGCSNGDNAGGRVVYGTALPSGHDSRPGLPSIEAFAAEAADPSTGVAAPGVLSVYAMNTPNASRSAYDTPSGVKPAPEGGPRFTRDPVDARYGSAIAGLRATTAAVPAGYTSLRSIRNGCKIDSTNFIITQPNVLIDCVPNFQNPQTEIIFTGAKFWSTKNILIAPSEKWTFSNPSLLVIDRNLTNKSALEVKGTLWVNTGTTTATPSLASNYCGVSRNGPGFTSTQLVIKTGDLSVSSGAKMCQTTLYMADGAASPRPDNDNNSYEGTLGFGGGSTDWTAPDQTELAACDPPTVVAGCYDRSLPQFQLEDLALWTESTPLSRIGGAGEVFLTGVFFLPNATFDFGGQAIQNIDRNAQFVARRLNMSGQGTLILKPDPNEAITIRTGISLLVR